MFKFLQTFKGLCIYIAILVILETSWIGLEYILDGRIVSLHSDTVMCFLMSFLITDKVYGFLFERKNK